MPVKKSNTDFWKTLFKSKLFQIVGSFIAIVLTIAIAYAIMFRNIEAKYGDAEIKSDSPKLLEQRK